MLFFYTQLLIKENFVILDFVFTLIFNIYLAYGRQPRTYSGFV